MSELRQLHVIVGMIEKLSPEAKVVLRGEVFGREPQRLQPRVVGHAFIGSATWKRHIGKSMVRYRGRMTPAQRQREINRRFGR